MKVLHSSLQNALNSEVSTLTRCTRITTADGDILGFTSFSQDLEIDGVTYKSSEGFMPTVLQTDNTFEPNNVQLASILSQAGITITDLKIGKYDYAKAVIFVVNYLDLPSSLNLNPPKHLVLLAGGLGKISYSENDYTAEMLSLTQYLQLKTSWVTSKTCRYDFGDSKCKVDKEDWKIIVDVKESLTHSSFKATDSWGDDYLTGGTLTWLDEPNKDITVSIIKQKGDTIYLAAPMPNLPIPQDGFSAIPNCQKQKQDCKFFKNYLNFGGEELPGLDAYYGQEEQ